MSWAASQASPHSTSRDRVRGYFDVLRRHGVDTAAVPIWETRNSEAATIAGLEAIFSRGRKPTALLCMSDWMALVALEWLALRGLSVPDDISVVGYDGVPEAATSSPPLTTVTQPIVEIGRRAVEIILSGAVGVQREVLDVALVVRASTARPKD